MIHEKQVLDWFHARGHANPHPELVAFLIEHGIQAITSFVREERFQVLSEAASIVEATAKERDEYKERVEISETLRHEAMNKAQIRLNELDTEREEAEEKLAQANIMIDKLLKHVCMPSGGWGD